MASGRPMEGMPAARSTRPSTRLTLTMSSSSGGVPMGVAGWTGRLCERPGCRSFQGYAGHGRWRSIRPNFIYGRQAELDREKFSRYVINP